MSHGEHVDHGLANARTSGTLVGHGQGRSYDVLSTLFFFGRRRRAFTRLASLSGARPGHRVLDVGCGTGYLTRILAEAVAPAGAAMGIDPSPEAIARARGLTRIANCTFAEGVAEALDAADGSYDVVASSLMLHHIPEALRPKAIGEMFRVLRSGGRVLVADFRPPTTRIGRSVLRGHVISPAMKNNPVHLLEPMIRDAGFEQVCGGDVQPWLRYVHALKPPGNHASVAVAEATA